MPRTQPADLFVEMARILAGAAPTLPRMPPGRVMELQSRSTCGLEAVLAEILEAERNRAAAARHDHQQKEAV